MILPEHQIVELHRRIKFSNVPNWTTLPGLDSQIIALKSLLVDVFVKKHNEAVLLLGPGGCCKHLLLDFCIHCLDVEYSKTNNNVFSKGEYIRINLDGDYLENDDDAFRVIARHLTSPTMRHKRFKNAQFKNMEFLEIVLQEAQICNIPLLFVLSNFSSFCHQSKQTLLYTLLDMCSNKNVQMGVIGIDRDCCIAEQLEKRIQSRFSQRQIIVNYPSPKDVSLFASSLLFLPGSDRLTRKWNTAIKRIVLHKDFRSLVEEQSQIFPLSYRRVLLYAISSLPDSVTALTIEFWKNCFDYIISQNTVNRNCTLSYLGLSDMALLITAKHLVQRKITNFCFLDILENYNKWAVSANNYQMKVMTESRAWQSFQVLLHFKLIKYVTIGSTVVGNNGRNENTKKASNHTVFRNGNEKNTPVILTMTFDEIDRIIKEGNVTCPTVLENWALKWAE